MRIRLSIPYAGSPGNLSQYTGTSDNSFGGVSFSVNEDVDEVDAWFVLDGLVGGPESSLVPEGKTFFVSSENIFSADYYLQNENQEFLKQFDQVISCHPTLLHNATFAPPFLPWMLNQAHRTVFISHARDFEFLRTLRMPEKPKLLSVFCSSKTFTPEQRVRLDFVKKLKAYFGNDLDWFGSGVNPIPEKWDGLAPYRFSIALENRTTPGMYTEKILDPFLTYTVPVYWGAPDIKSYLPLQRQQILDLRNLDESVHKIKALVERPANELFEEHLIAGRTAVLGPLHFLTRIVRILEGAIEAEPKRGAIRSITLLPQTHFNRAHRAEIFARKITSRLSPKKF